MSYNLPVWTFWVLLAVSISVAGFSVYYEIRKGIKYHSVAWDVYDKLSMGFRELIHANNEKERDAVYASIENERGKVPDKGLDKIINLHLDAEREQAKYIGKSIGDIPQHMISLTLERMRHYINRKYGGRNNG